MTKSEKTYIGVVGAGKCSNKLKEQAYAVGAAVAKQKAILVCGGLQGVMEAAAKGASEAGGTVIGIIPGYNRAEANRYCDFVIPTGLGDARNFLVIQSADAVVSLHGKYGTIIEMAYALKIGKPLVSLAKWDSLPEVICLTDPEQAVRKAIELISHGK